MSSYVYLKNIDKEKDVKLVTIEIYDEYKEEYIRYDYIDFKELGVKRGNYIRVDIRGEEVSKEAIQVRFVKKQELSRKFQYKPVLSVEQPTTIFETIKKLFKKGE